MPLLFLPARFEAGDVQALQPLQRGHTARRWMGKSFDLDALIEVVERHIGGPTVEQVWQEPGDLPSPGS